MRPSAPNPPAGDRHWHSSARLATTCALTFATLTLTIDWDAGTLTTPRTFLWLTLSTAVFAVLLPPRVTAGKGWLTSQTLTATHRVRTDALVSIRQYGDVASRLILRDAMGNRLELDPRTLLANPLLWHELDTGARHSLEQGTLHEGKDVLRRLTHEIDDEAALAVLRTSGLS
ncbi:hypothetical protein [Streptomyces sp. NPDC046909]|uniref:hypothetical protein n=1 Tax=Streptomyces sp. NPDC046909 TaxID=3155617 RepID=UPI0033EF0D8C